MKYIIIILIVISFTGCYSGKTTILDEPFSVHQYHSDSLCIFSRVTTLSRSEITSRHKAEYKLKQEIIYKAYHQILNVSKTNDLWDPDYKHVLTDSLEKLFVTTLSKIINDNLMISFCESHPQDDAYKTDMAGVLHYSAIAESFRNLANSNTKIPGNFDKNQLLSIADYYGRQLISFFENKLNCNGTRKSAHNGEVKNISLIDRDYIVQVHYRKKGLNEWEYPFFEQYDPYSYEQTAWDSLYIFTYPKMQLKRKIGLQIPMKNIQDVKYIEKDSNKLLFIQYEKGFELHNLTSENDSLITRNYDADMSTISPDGKKITYVSYKDFAVPEQSVFSNCLVDYYIDQDISTPYNRLQTSPNDEYFPDENTSRMQQVSEKDKYTYLQYDNNNRLVYAINNGQKISLDLNVIPSPGQVYYSDKSDQPSSKIIDTKFFPERNILYILSYVDDFEADYTGYSISLLDIDNEEYYAHVKVNINDHENIIEYNPETSSPSEIRDKLFFNLERDYKTDSIKLSKCLPNIHPYFIPDYIFDKNDTILVFNEANGLIKLNTETQDYLQFGKANIPTWFGYSAYVSTLFDYKSLYFTKEGKILSIQENNAILLWDVKLAE